MEVYNDREFVKSYSSKIEYNSHNALYERPATLSLLPDVRGMKVLDAGCGPGNYAEHLADRGAAVTAIDYSDEMVSYARERLGTRAEVFKANLNSYLDRFENEEFDLILSSMVIHYISNWQVLFSEFSRILKKGGILVFSTHHPFADFNIHKDGNYFDTELIKDEWPSYNIEMSYFRRPLSEIFSALRECDFRIDEVLEPLPVEECREKFPDAYAVLSTKPWFICFKVIKEN